MRTITLELLRHGPAHNQLLSPLTPYLALCENHGAVTFHVPFEHNQFLHRLSALSYRAKEDARLFQLRDTARILGDILSAIPGLTAESSKEEDGVDQLTHLRLILSASELALLPFELALSPDGFPGTGQHLLLQPQMPVCMTREIRRVPGEQLQWPSKPRILFVAATPPGVGPIPLKSHLLALRRVIDPWVWYYAQDKDEARCGTRTRAQRVAEHLVVLPEASIEAIEEACATNAFTHVHILAHGVERPSEDGFDRRFYLALHNSHDPAQTDYISGPRLATALRASKRPDSRGLSRPAVVTLASCDSANVGSVAGAGSSIAHALHEAGIPMVVAGQFPLSFEGSVRLVEILYEGMLRGTDPRRLLYDLRRRLYAQFRETHDWASLTTYVSLPPDFEQQISKIQIDQAARNIEAAMSHADKVTGKIFAQNVPPLSRAARRRRAGAAGELAPGSGGAKQDGGNEPPDAAGPPDAEKNEEGRLFDQAVEKISQAKGRLERLLQQIPSERSRIHLGLASTEKRQAEIFFSATRRGYVTPQEEAQNLQKSWLHLTKAHDHYWQSFLLDRSNGWAVAQYLSLEVVLRNGARVGTFSVEGGEREAKNVDALWSLAHLLNLHDLQSQGREVPPESLLPGKTAVDFQKDQRELAIWAHANLVELYLLTLNMPAHPQRPSPDEAEERALKNVDHLLDLTGRDSFKIYSTRRQIQRYVEWYAHVCTLDPTLLALAGKVLEKLPPEDQNVSG